MIFGFLKKEVQDGIFKMLTENPEIVGTPKKNGYSKKEISKNVNDYINRNNNGGGIEKLLEKALEKRYID